jgi:hypothetical protein
MAEYKGIKGFKVQTVSTDPAASIVATGTWASGGDLPASKYVGYSAGSQTANLFAGGATAPPANGNQVGTTYKYDGSSWTAGNNLNETRFDGAGFGTQTAAIAATGAKNPGSSRTNAVESWDGTNWTEVAEVNSQRYGPLGTGTQTAGLIAAGYDGSYRAYTEIWNGSAWTEVNDLNNAGADRTGAGTSTAAIGAGGTNSAGTANTAVAEQWNGSSWTEVGDLNTARSQSASSGTYTNAIVFGGNAGGAVGNTEFWDGTSWTELADLSTARIALGGSPAGTTAAGLAAGGDIPPGTTATEEWTIAPPASFQQENLGQVFYNSTSNAFKVTQQSVSSGTWASGGDLNTARSEEGAGGTQTSTVIGGGRSAGSPPGLIMDNAETYNGSAWTTVSTINTARRSALGAGDSNTAAIIFGGPSQASPPFSATAINESWEWNFVDRSK